MAFFVTPGALNTQATSLRALADAAPGANSYLTEHLTLDFIDTSFLFAKALDAANQTRDAISPYLTALQTALDASADELDATALDYVNTDDSSEAALDAAYPEIVERDAPMTPPSNQSVYTVPAAPGDALVTPGQEPELDLVSTILTTDWLSPSSLVAQLLDFLFDWNYLEVISKNFSGDWNRLYEVTHALQHLSAFHTAQADNVTYAMSVSASSWSGNAADAANAFFTESARLLRDAATEISELAPEFEAVARGMRDTADAVGGIFAQIMDAAIAAAFFYAAGTVLVETVVGTIIGYLAGTGILAYMAWLAHQAWEVIQTALLIFDLLGAATGVLAQFFAGGADLPLPVAYNNPEV